MAQCTATSSRTHKQCRKQAIAGGTVCATHGGSAPQVRKAAARRLALGRAMGDAGRLLDELGGTSAGQADPLSTLLEAVALARAMVRVFTELIAGLNLEGVRIVVNDDGEDVRVVMDPRAIVGPTHLGDLGVHPYVELLERWVRTSATISKQALDAGISERQQQLAEGYGRQVAVAFRDFADSITQSLIARGFDEHQVQSAMAEMAPGLMRRALERAMETGTEGAA